MDIEEQFKNYFNLGLIGMAITSLEKGWIEVNNKLCEIFGYSQEELIKLSWDEITYPDDLNADEAEFTRVLAGEIEGYSMDKRFIRKDGKIIYTSISANCVRKDDGSIDHFVAFVQNISERKQAEKELEEHRDQLEALVNERTGDLTTVNEKLKTEIIRRENIELDLIDREANLEKANASKSRFLAAASHDLRQPLQSLEMYFLAMTHPFLMQQRCYWNR